MGRAPCLAALQCFQSHVRSRVQPHLGAVNTWIVVLLAFFIPLSTALSSALALLFALLWLLEGDFRRKFQEMREHPLCRAVLLYLAALALGILWNAQLDESLTGIRRQWKMLLVPLILTALPPNRPEVGRRILWAFVAGVGLMAVSTLLAGLGWLHYADVGPDHPTRHLFHVVYNPMLALALYAFLARLTRGQPWRRVWRDPSLPLFLLMLVSMFITEGRAGQLAFLVLVGLLICQLARPPRWAALVLALTAALLGCCLAAYGLSPVVREQVNSAWQATGLFQDHPVAPATSVLSAELLEQDIVLLAQNGLVGAVGLLWLFVATTRRRPRRGGANRDHKDSDPGFLRHPGLVVLLVLMLAAMFMDEYGAGLLALLVLAGLFVCQWVPRPPRWVAVLALLPAPLLLFGAAYGLSPVFRDRVNLACHEVAIFQEDPATSVGFRLFLWQQSLGLMKEAGEASPLVLIGGVGTGGFESAYRAYNARHAPDMRVFDNPHNQYILALVQNGLLGVAALLGLFITQIRLALARNGNGTDDDDNDEFRRRLRLAFPVFFLVIMLTESYLMAHETGMLFSVLGAALYRDARLRRKDGGALGRPLFRPGNRRRVSPVPRRPLFAVLRGFSPPFRRRLFWKIRQRVASPRRITGRSTAPRPGRWRCLVKNLQNQARKIF